MDAFRDDPILPPAAPTKRRELDVDSLLDAYNNSDAHTKFILHGCLAYCKEDSDAQRPWLNKNWAWWAFHYAGRETQQRLHEIFPTHVGFPLDTGPVTWTSVPADYERLPSQYVHRVRAIPTAG